MRTYEKYKPSGIEWIGDIPEHWGTQRLKYFARIFNGQDHKGVWDEDGEYPIMGTGGEFGRGKSYLHKGPSVLLGRKGTIDKPIFVDFPFWSVDTAYFTDIYPETHPRYFFYLCKNIQFDKIKYGSAVPSMTQEVLNQVILPVPSLEEQNAIADYLDKETARIDEVVGKKKRLIELLKEERLAIINQAVTRGLDPNAKLKPSNIEWLGDIPEHWELRKISRSFRLISSGTTPTAGDPLYHSNGTINWVNTGDLNDGPLFECEKKVTLKAMEDYSTLKVYGPGTLLIAMYGATIGKASILKFEACTNQACCALAKSDFFDIEYVFYWFLSSKADIINLSFGGGQPNISQEVIRSLKVTCPPISEQKQIVKEIESKTQKIDATIVKVEKEIGLLSEYRTALISEVVTGKIRVS